MASKINTGRAVRSFKKLERNPVIAELAVAVYQKPFRDGLVERLNNATWPPNSPEWAARKRSKKRSRKLKFSSDKPWVRTGKTLKSITNNPPEKLGPKKGITTGVNWRNSQAFAVPRTFTDAKGKRLPADRQDKIFKTLKRGSAMAKLNDNAKKRGRTLQEVLSEVFGPKRNAVAIPARPLFAWSKNWQPEMEQHIDAAVKRVMAKEGFTVR
jgi:hypothetical protein